MSEESSVRPESPREDVDLAGDLMESAVEGHLLNDDARKQLGLKTIQFRGPLPPPDLLRQYQEIQPDFPERILRLTEQEAEHRRSVTRNVIRIEGAEVILGQIFGLFIALSALGVSAYLAVHGAQTVASIIGGGTLVALVTVFIRGRTKARDDNDDSSAHGDARKEND